MPLKGVHYRVVTRGGKKIRLAFRGDKVVEHKVLGPSKKRTKKTRRKRK